MLDLCGKATVISLKPFLLILKGMMVAHTSLIFTYSSSGTSDFTLFVDWRFLLSWSRCPTDVAMMGGRYFNNCWLLSPVYMRKFPFLISFRKVIVVGMKHHPWRYCISSVLSFSFVMTAITQCLTGIDMGMSHRTSLLFLVPFKISVLSLRILMSLISKIATQSSLHFWPKEISEALCKPSNMCAFFCGNLDWLIEGCFLILSYSSSHCLAIGLLVNPWSSLHLWGLSYLQFSSNYLTQHCKFCYDWCMLWWVYNRAT